jgi:hypothetical protein
MSQDSPADPERQRELAFASFRDELGRRVAGARDVKLRTGRGYDATLIEVSPVDDLKREDFEYMQRFLQLLEMLESIVGKTVVEDEEKEILENMRQALLKSFFELREKAESSIARDSWYRWLAQAVTPVNGAIKLYLTNSNENNLKIFREIISNLKRRFEDFK